MVAMLELLRTFDHNGEWYSSPFDDLIYSFKQLGNAEVLDWDLHPKAVFFIA